MSISKTDLDDMKWRYQGLPLMQRMVISFEDYLYMMAEPEKKAVNRFPPKEDIPIQKLQSPPMPGEKKKI